MVGTFIENVQGHTTSLRDLENTHHQKLEEISITTLEKVVKNELEDDIPDDLREVGLCVNSGCHPRVRQFWQSHVCVLCIHVHLQESKQFQNIIMYNLSHFTTSLFLAFSCLLTKTQL